MKKAVVKTPAPALVAVEPKKRGRGRPPTVRAPRFCERTECKRELTPSQSRFCGAECRNLAKLGGAPVIYPYHPSYAKEKLQEYFQLCREENEPNLVPTDSSFIVINRAKVPSKADYAVFLKVTVRVVKDWEEKYVEFARAMEELMTLQQAFLLNYGASGRYNPVISRLALGVNHGMIERKQIDNTHKHIGIVKHLYEKADDIERDALGL